MVNEFDSKVATSTIDWRTKFDSQSGAILAGEIKNNMCRMMQVAAEGILSGAESIKLGYISRLQPRNPNKHEVLRVETYPCREFIKLLNTTPRAMFSSLKYFFQAALDLEPGKYVLVRDPNQLSISIYSVPDTTFDAKTGSWCVDIDVDTLV
uniref:Eukaryotic translation initiation factor 3 subunit p66 n=1 Tax=Lygus hesperus TaxID=30085 RepID=A0A0A9WWE2_LYGHE